jgi:sec-independent protein translocase protein TatB
MFDVGFSEILVIGVVALIVIGPERLPKVARTMGHLMGRMQRYVNDVKADISREMELEELRKLQTDMQEAARSIESSVNKEISDTEQALNQTIAPALEAVGAAGNPNPPAASESAGPDGAADKPATPHGEQHAAGTAAATESPPAPPKT